MVRRRDFTPIKLLDLWDESEFEKRYSEIREEAQRHYPKLKELSERTFIRYLNSLVENKLLEKRFEERKTFYKPTSEAFKERTKNNMIETLSSSDTYFRNEINISLEGFKDRIWGPFLLKGFPEVAKGLGLAKNYVFSKPQKKVIDKDLFDFTVNSLLDNFELLFPLILSSLPEKYWKDQMDTPPLDFSFSNTVQLTLRIDYKIPNLERLHEIYQTYNRIVEAKNEGFRKWGFRTKQAVLEKGVISPSSKELLGAIKMQIAKLDEIAQITKEMIESKELEVEVDDEGRTYYHLTAKGIEAYEREKKKGNQSPTS